MSNGALASIVSAADEIGVWLNRLFFERGLQIASLAIVDRRDRHAKEASDLAEIFPLNWSTSFGIS